jgi:hypothetical protein
MLEKKGSFHSQKVPQDSDQNQHVWSFIPPLELLEWLEEERWENEQGQSETNAALLTRKLEKLRRLENQGY